MIIIPDKAIKRQKDGLFKNFLEKVNWKKKVPALCKPCWELKYCPYGPLVEDFPLKQERDSKSCIIFGHDCPVFYVAEPFTETKEFRRVTRHISRPVMLSVVQRDGLVCSICQENIAPEEVQFDNIIPFSKGGSSDESNIRVLCELCNRTKSDKFELNYLISHVNEHLVDHLDIDFVEIFIDVMIFAQEYKVNNGCFPDTTDINNEFGGKMTTDFEIKLVESMNELNTFFQARKPKEFSSTQFKALKTRWGFDDGNLYALHDISEEFKEDIGILVSLERALLARLGWYVKETKAIKRSWTNL